jgi:hypothetical protein
MQVQLDQNLNHWSICARINVLLIEAAQNEWLMLFTAETKRPNDAVKQWKQKS